jgi:DNA-binding MarR family transcriptional regulator
MRYRIIRYRSCCRGSGVTSFLAYIAELHRAVHAIGLFLDSHLEGGVSQPEALVILHLAGRSPTTINELHHAFLHRRSTLTSVLDRMESKGLVKRASAEDDRRNVVLTLTAKGRRAAGTISRAVAELNRELDSSVSIGPSDVARVRAVAETAARAAK